MILGDQKKNFKKFSVIILFIFFVLLAFATPLSGDDLMWGSAEGMNLLRHGFSGYNGRLLSNTMEILWTQSIPLRIILYGIFSTLLIVLTVSVVLPWNRQKSWHYFLTVLLYLTLAADMYSQTFGWFAGYSNYVSGMLPVLAFVIWLRYRSNRIISWWEMLLLAVLGFVSALIVEHITLYVLILGLSSVVWLIRSHKQSWLGSCAYSVGVIIGTALMFANPAYVRIFTGGDSLRKLSFGSRLISSVTTIYSQQMYHYIFQDNGIMILLLSSVLIVLVWKSSHGNVFGKVIVSTLLSGYALFCLMAESWLNPINFGVHGMLTWIAPILSLFFLGGVIASVALYLDDRQLAMRFWFYIVSSLLLSAPFVVMAGYGPRCAFDSIVFIIIATIDATLTWIGGERVMPSVARYSIIMSASVVMVGVLGMMGLNHHYYAKRQADVQEQTRAGKSTIYLRRLPFDQLTWDTAPVDTRGVYRRTLAKYHLDKNKQRLLFVTFGQWKNYKSKW